MIDIGYEIAKAAKRYKNKIAVVDGSKQFTFAEINERANRLANGLLAMGIEKGSRVNILCSNSYHIIEIYFALAKADMCRVVLHRGESVDDLVFKINNCGSNTIIYEEEFIKYIEEIKPKVDKLKRFICLTKNSSIQNSWMTDYETLLMVSSPKEPEVIIDEHDYFRMSHSGGTSGVPKAIVQTHGTMSAAIIRLLLEIVPLKDDDIFIQIHPMTHYSGLLIEALWIRGVKQIIAQSTQVEYILRTIEKERITSTFLVPTLLIRIVDYENINDYDCSSLKWIVYGAAACPPAKLMKAVKTFGPVFCQMWAQAEVTACVTVLTPKDHMLTGASEEEILKRYSSCGREGIGCRVKIVDQEGKELPIGEVGEFIVKSDNAMIGYYNKPKETAEALRNGWVFTRDTGYTDENGYFYVCGRTSDMIISGGFNVYPNEIENVLARDRKSVV